ncbi:unnamed protein product [Cyclocybe aegerita]|uniref:Retrotransposon gag domain-containing protein n=1 Tax=Cyclocybe aegerita TaxID=1973307 RepID=A0A8S0WQI3_CYCAE|nr:unnamed protein product [Cyclocybe aegerita]
MSSARHSDPPWLDHPGIPDVNNHNSTTPRKPGGDPSGSPGLWDIPEQETPTAHAGVGRADEPSEGPADYGTNYYDRDDREDVRRGRDDRQALDRHGAVAARPMPHPHSANSPHHHNEYMTDDDAIQAALQSADELEERLARIYHKVAEMEEHQNRNVSPQAGPSTLRGKQIDPRNWGAAGVPDDDLDIQSQRRNENAQRELHDRLERMKDLKAQYLAEKKKAEEHAQTLKAGASQQQSNPERRSTSLMSRDMEDLISRTMRGDLHGRYTGNATPRDNTQSGQRVQQPEVLQASNQVAPDSFLGRALHGRGGGGGGGGGDDGPPPDDFNFGQADDWNGANDGFGMGWGVPDDGDGGNHAFRPRYKPLSLTPPDKYHSDADPLKFYRYVNQCERFCCEAGLPMQDRIPKCADSLAGKAYKFYTTSVSMDAHLWTMRQFFNELFNYCFPPDFHLKQCARLDGFKQNNMKVTEYAAELMVLFKTIGTSTPCECVEKLWNRLREELQRVLWQENLDPIQSTWAEVVHVAMRHEVAD